MFQCPYCSMSTAEEVDTHYGCDVRRSDDEAYLVYTPCCLDMKAEVEHHGFEAAYGVSVVDVVRQIAPDLDALEIAEGIGSNIIGRLVINDPAVPVGEPDDKGIYRAKSPSGFRDQVFDFMVHHRHHEAPTGHKFSVEVYNASIRVGAAVVSRPVSRVLSKSEPKTMEVTRVCTHAVLPEMTKNAASKLYSACAKKAKKLGATKLITYTLLEEESGHSLIASGWTPTKISAGGSWDRKGRSREDKAPTTKKVRWEKGLNKSIRKEIATRKICLEARSDKKDLFEKIVDAIACVDSASAWTVSSYLGLDEEIVNWSIKECLGLGILVRKGTDIHGEAAYALG